MSEGIIGKQGRWERKVEAACNSERGERVGEGGGWGGGREGREREGERSVFQPGLCGPRGSSTARLDLEVIDRQH